MSLSSSGAFLFMPGAGVCGPASFKYHANDGTTDSNEATVSIVVDCLPHAGADSVTVLEDSGTNTITVLSNDTDPDPGQALHVTSVGSAAHGVDRRSPSAAAAINYAPAADLLRRRQLPVHDQRRPRRHVDGDGHGDGDVGQRRAERSSRARTRTFP